MAETITARVQRGAKLLDKELPGWHTRINLHNLDLNNCEQCILGQLYGDYSKGLDAMFHGDQQYFSRYHFGFSSFSVRGKDKMMLRLTVAWVWLLVNRILGRLSG